MALIPATILTGFLGSGKTTLLKRVLTEAHGQKIAVIENEFGDENIDNEILVQDSREQIIQLNNGCVCCTIREDLRSTLADLAEKRRKGELDFERVVIETTGVADPGPVAQTFFMDDEIAESYVLDSILTLVDAKHGDQQLDARQEARRQVGFADQIFISKSELVDDAAFAALSHRIKHMNPRAPQRKVHFGEVPLAEVFDLRGFNLNAKLDIDPELNLRTLLRPAVFVPESKGLNELLRDFRANRNHLAIVIDEFGNTAGLLTIEDVLEEIVGEIEDEFDDKDGESSVYTLADGSHRVAGDAAIRSVNEAFSARLPEHDFDTIGGLVAHELGRVPRRGETVALGGLQFGVMLTRGGAVRWFKVTHAATVEPGGDGA